MVDSRQGSLAKPLSVSMVTNVTTSPDLYIEFSTELVESSLYEALNSEQSD